MDHLIDDDIPRHERERELTLSTGAILGIFLGLVVLCGACFGFGYNMGRKSAPTPLNLNATTEPSAQPASPDIAKPAAGSPANSSDQTVIATPAPAPRPPHRTPPADTSAIDTSEASTEAPKPAVRATPPQPAPVVREPAPAGSLATSTPAPTPASGGAFMVQVAAVSHQEDADLLVGALRSRGYTVTARPGASDSFIHVQVGPFSSKKDADAMRQRLLADGYNAIVKQ